MKIGYAVEGSVDRAFLRGLRDRWCPGAELVEGHFRGSTKMSQRREIKKICLELTYRGADYVVFLTDSDRDDWRAIRNREFGRVPDEHQHLVVYGVPEQNIEDWLRADPVALAEAMELVEHDVRNTTDPKGLLHSILPRDEEERESKIALFVRHAPLDAWLKSSPSFERFYEDIRDIAQQSATCDIPNERDA